MNIKENIANFDFDYYLSELEHKHRIFYSLINIGDPVFYEKIPTLAVVFDKKSQKIVLLINPNFFFNKTLEQQIFLLSHEAMHVLLGHLAEKYNKLSKNEIKILNVAQDIVINENLTKDFDFDLKEIKKLGICFVETIFSKYEIQKYQIPKNETSEYYYELLKKLNKGNSPLEEALEDTTNNSEGRYGPIPENILEDLINKTLNELSPSELQDIQSSYLAGNGTLGKLINVILKRPSKIPKWQKIVKKHASSLLKNDYLYKDVFHLPNRRNQNLPEDLFLPNYSEIETKTPKKYNLYFFLDASGSCAKFSDKFFNFAKTIPENLFNLTLFSFDDSVYKLDVNKNFIQGWGGTSFDIIERQCLLEKKYPDLIFIITDGYGNSVVPKYPKKWIWFLTGYSSTQYIHQDSQFYRIDDIFKE